MALLTKVVEIISNTTGDSTPDIFVCTACTDTHTHTVVPAPETKEGDCEWHDHI